MFWKKKSTKNKLLSKIEEDTIKNATDRIYGALRKATIANSDDDESIKSAIYDYTKCSLEHGCKGVTLVCNGCAGCNKPNPFKYFGLHVPINVETRLLTDNRAIIYVLCNSCEEKMKSKDEEFLQQIEYNILAAINTMQPEIA